jgi:hypothetical protein
MLSVEVAEEESQVEGERCARDDSVQVLICSSLEVTFIGYGYTIVRKGVLLEGSCRR